MTIFLTTLSVHGEFLELLNSKPKMDLMPGKLHKILFYLPGRISTEESGF